MVPTSQAEIPFAKNSTPAFPYAGLRQLSSCFNGCVLRRESNRPRNKQVKSSLIKRGKEMHEPDRMYLNPSQIVFAETVGTNSKVAQLIAQAQH